jgi:NTE family protein
MKDIVMALGGGGVKGFAHIGVLRVLEREGFRIAAIAGTSAGGLIGSFYAAGYSPDEIERAFLEIDHNKIYNRLPGDGPSMMGLQGVVEVLRRLLGERTFQDTRIPFAVTAVNLDTAQLLALQRGLLIEAVLATIAVPGIFPPKLWENKRLVDGGVLAPVPIELARQLAPELPVIAVVLSPPVDHWVNKTPPRLLESMPFITQYLGRMRIAQAFNIFLRSVDIAGAEMTEMRLAIDQPEIIIRPDVPNIGFLDRVNVPEVTRLGELAATRYIPEINKETGWTARFSRQWTRKRKGNQAMKWFFER